MFGQNVGYKLVYGQTFVTGCVVKGILTGHASSDDILCENPQKLIIIRVFRPYVRFLLDFCGFSQVGHKKNNKHKIL